MKRLIVFVTVVLASLSWSSQGLYGQDDVRIWKEFVMLLKENRITPDRIRPLEFLSKESQIQALNTFRRGAVWQERANNAGWDLQIVSRGVQCFFYFKR